MTIAETGRQRGASGDSDFRLSSMRATDWWTAFRRSCVESALIARGIGKVHLLSSYDGSQRNCEAGRVPNCSERPVWQALMD